MSATVLPFTGNWEGRIEPSSFEMVAQRTAMADARQIVAAKASADNWMSVVLLGLLASMHKPDLLRLELAIGTHAERNDGARQALALVRLGSSGKDHRARVLAAIEVLQAREA